ncbi:MAG TPA: NAD-dependent epimerase/dehydratase family protein [Solirubrobacteraceae bacterium]|jgi:nucleoside-diphosphate-sugar epimerase|nr:NAD-dependent epimerase/dehydratase family protein [Solirubrobacteraceae bacterium]
MATVLVTGAAGFIGSHLAQRCLAEGHRVLGIDAFTSYYDPELKRANVAHLEDNPLWTFLEGDLVNLDLVCLLQGVDVVFHLAAQAGVRSSWGETFGSYVDSNVTALQRLLEASRSAPLERFVFASSSSVYGDAERLPTNENASLQPISPYGATKALGEYLCRLYYRSHGLPTVMLRYFTVYGPRQRPDMAFNKLIRAALTREEIVIYGDGDQTRDFTFVSDAVGGTIAAAADGHPGAVYNLGGGARTSMNEVLEMIADLTGEELTVRRVAAQAGDARDTAADTSKARAQLGFAPSRALYEGLSDQVAWHRSEGLPVATASALDN